MTKKDELKSMNEYNIHPMFYVPLFYTKLEGLPNAIKNEIINPESFCYDRLEHCWISNTHQLLNIKTFEPLKQKILEAAIIYVRDILRISYNLNFKIVSSWSLKHGQNDFADIHIHRNSIISGVYYPVVNDYFGKIWFYRETPLFTPTVELPYLDYNDNNCDMYFITPEIDSLILFPSHIKHSVNKNKSNFDRFSIAFNIFFEGNFSAFETKIDELIIKISGD